ncbi:hypothetical protein N9V95_00010 [bacterium]|nr:hypothetical protein [bacterium]
MIDRDLVCACGEVHIALKGEPMVSAKCFCDDCQAAGAFFANAPYAQKMLDADHGTGFDLYRKDRYEITMGADKLEPIKTKERSITNRNVATCCNSVLFASFDRGPHWVSVYRNHVAGPPRKFDHFIQTKFAPAPFAPPKGINAAKTYPPSMMAKLMFERLRMTVGF